MVVSVFSFQIFCLFFLTPETRNLTPDTAMYSHTFEKPDGARDITRPDLSLRTCRPDSRARGASGLHVEPSTAFRNRN